MSDARPPYADWPPAYHPPTNEPRNLIRSVIGAGRGMGLRLEEQLTEALAWLLSRSDGLARDVIREFLTDGEARTALEKAEAIGVATEVRLPPLIDGRGHLRPDLSLTGSDRAFHLLVEVKARSDPHEVVTSDGTSLDQVAAYEAAWKRLDPRHEAEVCRVGSLAPDRLKRSGDDSMRAGDLTWAEVATVVDEASKAGDVDAELAAVAGDFVRAIRELFDDPANAPEPPPKDFFEGARELVAQAAAELAEALGAKEEPRAPGQGTDPASAYVGTYVNFRGAEGEPAQLWVQVTHLSGWYRTYDHSTALWLVSHEDNGAWSEKTKEAFRHAGLIRSRDTKGYTSLRDGFEIDDEAICNRDLDEFAKVRDWARGIVSTAAQELGRGRGES